MWTTEGIRKTNDLAECTVNKNNVRRIKEWTICPQFCGEMKYLTKFDKWMTIYLSQKNFTISVQLIYITIFLFSPMTITQAAPHSYHSKVSLSTPTSISSSLTRQQKDESSLSHNPSLAYLKKLNYARRVAKCIGLVKTCEQDRQNCDPSEDEMEEMTNEIFQPDDSPIPVFHCYSPGQQPGVFEAIFRWEYPTTGILKRIFEGNSMLIPRIFVVEKSMDGVWETDENSINVTNFWVFPYEDVREDHEYSIRITPVSPTVVYSPQTLPARQFYGEKVRTTGKVTNVSIEFDSKTVGTGATKVLLRWKSGSGSNASCHYKIYYFDDDMGDFHAYESKGPRGSFWKPFTANLRYEKNYKIHIAEKFGEAESAQEEVSWLKVPTCWSVHHSFKNCPPPKPINLTVASGSSGSLKITWAPPPYANETNTIVFYNLTVRLFEYVPTKSGAGLGESMHSLQKSVYTWKLLGNETFFFIEGKNITFKDKIQVSLFAISEGGESDVAVNSLDFRRQIYGEDEGFITKVWIPLIVVLLLTLIIVLLFWLKSYRGKRQRKKQLHEYFEKLDKESIQIDPIDDKYSSKWEISSGAIVLGRVIGEGAFGLVRAALLYRNGTVIKVAVKTLRDGVDEKDCGKFWEEFNILKGLDPHKHVVGLVGIVKTHIPALVVEYCHGGDLQTHLRKASQARTRYNGRRYSHHSGASSSSTSSNNEVRVRMTMVTNEVYFMNKAEPEETVTELDLLSYSRQIACGMEFLSSNKIVHRDLAARNVLIGHNRVLKIADFGLSRDVYEQNWYKKNSDGKIPIKWLGPECLLNEMYTSKSDVWSYGILLWEIVTYGGNPYPGIENTRIFDLLNTGYRMPQPDNCSDELYHLMGECWRNNPEDRPSFTAIRHKLDGIVEKSNFTSIYMNLQHGPTESESSSLISGEQD